MSAADLQTVVCTQPVQHDGVRYEPGAALQLAADAAGRLVACGAATFAQAAAPAAASDAAAPAPAAELKPAPAPRSPRASKS
jgi:hypothetical protein